MRIRYCLLLLLFYLHGYCQNTIEINAELDTLSNQLKIEQQIVFYNTSKKSLNEIYLHNWANSFKNKKTPLGKRLLENYDKNFFFSKERERGYCLIDNLSVDSETQSPIITKKNPDIIKIKLITPLKSKDSTVIRINYTIKIPHAKFTGYGKTKNGYHLRFWYITPAVFETKWKVMNNLNLDDLYQNTANYAINLKIPKNYYLESNVTYQKTDSILYSLTEQKQKDIIVSITRKKRFQTFTIDSIQVKTDITDRKISSDTEHKIIAKEIRFIKQLLGEYPHRQILIDANTANKNRLEEIYSLPSWLKAYPKNFKWEINFLKALVSKYVDDVILVNKREDYWLTEGIKIYIIMNYINKYYPDVNILGKYGNFWGIKRYNFAKLKQSDKFLFLYQFSVRKFFDQPLNMKADKLSNFNLKIISPYKSGLGLQYLNDFLEDDIIKSSIKEFYQENKLQLAKSSSFEEKIKKKTNKDLDWFFKDYLQTDKKIDYRIERVKKTNDSIAITIKNNREIAAPILLQGLKDKKISFKQWLPNIKSRKTITIASGKFSKIALNHRCAYPEFNFSNNYSKLQSGLFKKPLKFKFIKDIEDPYYTQIFFKPNIKYNYYDGVILGMNFSNQTIIKKDFYWTVIPNYAIKSKSLTGGTSFGYRHFLPQSEYIYFLRFGASASNYHYNKNLAYTAISPYLQVVFNRKNLRDVGNKSLYANIKYINKEIPKNQTVLERDKYTIGNITFNYNYPGVIKGRSYSVKLEGSQKFSKISTDLRYRQFFSKNGRFDIRFFGGYFIHNKTKSNYFSFGLNGNSDYLFEQNFYGRSEDSGIFSQQFIVSDGGFKSRFSKNVFANESILALNSSTSLWRWLELYNDFGMLKNKRQKPDFFYENGIRLNFVPNFLEFYFPVYTNEGWQVNQHGYPSKIRFVFTANINRIYEFIRRGVL